MKVPLFVPTSAALPIKPLPPVFIWIPLPTSSIYILVPRFPYWLHSIAVCAPILLNLIIPLVSFVAIVVPNMIFPSSICNFWDGLVTFKPILFDKL